MTKQLFKWRILCSIFTEGHGAHPVLTVDNLVNLLKTGNSSRRDVLYRLHEVSFTKYKCKRIPPK
jgi:hypothetical protein